MATKTAAQKMEEEVHRHLKDEHSLSRTDFATSAQIRGGGKIHVKVEIKKSHKRSEVSKTLQNFADKKGFTLEWAA